MRLGRIEVSAFMMIEHSNEAADIFAFMKFVPLRVERLGYKDVFDMIGISRLFDEIPDGSVAPYYELTIETEVFDKGESFETVLKDVVAVRGDFNE